VWVSACVCVRECHVSVCMHVCGCVPARGRACEGVRLSLLSTICWQESNKHHGLSLTMSGVRSCLFGSGTSRLHAMMFQTSTYMGICMSICMCVRSSACLHRCMYMSCTHNTHIYAHTTHARGMSTPRYVHITHTPHTHIRTHRTDNCLSLYVCVFWDNVNGSLYVRRSR